MSVRGTCRHLESRPMCWLIAHCNIWSANMHMRTGSICGYPVGYDTLMYIVNVSICVYYIYIYKIHIYTCLSISPSICIFFTYVTDYVLHAGLPWWVVLPPAKCNVKAELRDFLRHRCGNLKVPWSAWCALQVGYSWLDCRNHWRDVVGRITGIHHWNLGFWSFVSRVDPGTCGKKP